MEDLPGPGHTLSPPLQNVTLSWLEPGHRVQLVLAFHILLLDIFKRELFIFKDIMLGYKLISSHLLACLYRKLPRKTHLLWLKD